jgi:AraC-like DNA-binding protein
VFCSRLRICSTDCTGSPLTESPDDVDADADAVKDDAPYGLRQLRVVQTCGCGDRGLEPSDRILGQQTQHEKLLRQRCVTPPASVNSGTASSIELRFAHRRPVDVAPFRGFFKAPLRFDAEQYAAVFSAAWLARALSGADPDLRRLLQEQINKLEHQHEDDFAAQVRSMLRHALVTGHAGADQIAALFLVDRRTLNRRLNAQGSGFQQIVDEVRFEIARQMLTDSAVDIVQIADLLGCANASAFTRGFRRWSGDTPATWRQQAEAKPGHP